jgi:hypothetical protein
VLSLIETKPLQSADFGNFKGLKFLKFHCSAGPLSFVSCSAGLAFGSSGFSKPQAKLMAWAWLGLGLA